VLGLRDHSDAAVREAVAFALGGRSGDDVLAALIALSADDDVDVRDWATFALGMLSSHDTPELREALVARLGDEHPETRLEAVHGLAVRGDVRAVEPALELLAEAARTEGDGMWRRLELRETAQRLAAQTGDERFEPYLPG
jgi:HEAT repeat protein